MPEKTYQTALVLIPPQEVWPSIQAIREQYDQKMRRWMPHITLIYPFSPKAEFEDLAKKLSQACQKLQPFEVTFKGFKFFQHRKQNCTLWLEPTPKEELTQLLKTLKEAIPDEEKSKAKEFTPHLTVGQIQGKEETRQLQQKLQENWTTLTFKAQEVSLIWRNDPPDDVFQLGATVSLGV